MGVLRDSEFAFEFGDALEFGLGLIFEFLLSLFGVVFEFARSGCPRLVELVWLAVALG